MEALRSALSKDEGELIKSIAAGNNFVAGTCTHPTDCLSADWESALTESGRMLGCRQDKVAFFEAEEFDLDQFAELHLSNLTEKGLGTLKGDLAGLQERCEDEVV